MKNPLAHTARVPRSPCPYCGHPLDAASGERDPTPGDISVCIQCAQPLCFTDDLTLRVLAPAEFDALDLPLKNQLRLYMRAVRTMDRRR